MRHSFLAVLILAAAACVDVPDGVRAQFAGPGAGDRSNYRPGTHGLAPPNDADPPAAKAAQPAVTGAAVETGADGGAAATDPSADGGAP